MNAMDCAALRWKSAARFDGHRWVGTTRAEIMRAAELARESDLALMRSVGRRRLGRNPLKGT